MVANSPLAPPGARRATYCISTSIRSHIPLGRAVTSNWSTVADGCRAFKRSSRDSASIRAKRSSLGHWEMKKPASAGFFHFCCRLVAKNGPVFSPLERSLQQSKLAFHRADHWDAIGGERRRVDVGVEAPNLIVQLTGA